ncbi:MAG TPA: cytochrome c biogenesis protein CcdA, partial [bacterium]|nr:cytochrome c biogenesis protein CcdA [bacterium]
HTISQQWIGLSAGTIKPINKINPNQAVGSISLQSHSIAEPENKSSASHDSVAQTVPDKVSTIQERTASYESLRKESLGSFIGLAFLTGLLALLTPCVFPMIPITVSYFTKHSASSRAGAVRQSVIYVVGIIASFTLFGWLMSLVVGATGAQNFAANAWVNLAIGILFIVFAMSLFGVFEIRLPSFIVNFSQQQANTGQTIGTLMAGVTFTLVSFTCTVQFLGLLMVAAADGEWFLPVIGMLCFATAFSTPFFFLSLFPQYLANLPKSGGWLHATKIVMGLVEIAAAFKFFSNVDLVWDLQWLTRPAMLSIWITLFGVSGIYLLGKIRWSVEDEVEEIGFGRTMTGLLFISFTVYLLSGLFGNPLQADMDAYLPPSDYGVVRTAGNAKSTESHETWIEDYEAALREARTSGKPLFIDFTGKTCTNCRLMEKTMFTRADVQFYFDRMVLTRLWTDFGENMERYQDLQQRLVGSVALPFYVIITPDEKVLARFGGLERDPEIFKSFLADGLQKSQK